MNKIFLPFQIIKYTTEKKNLLEDFILKFYPEDDFYDIDSFESFYENGDFFVTLNPKNQIVACFSFFYENKDKAVIKRVIISPYWINKGVFEKNIRFMLSSIIEKGYKEVILIKNEHNEYLNKFKESGFKDESDFLFLDWY